MNKAQLVSRISEMTEIHPVDVEHVVTNLFSLIENEVSLGGEVMLRGFAKFHGVVRKQKKARNMHTGETVIVPERTEPTAKFFFKIE